QALPLCFTVSMQPGTGSMSGGSSSAMHVPVLHSWLQAASDGVNVHASGFGSHVSVVHEKPSLQIGGCRQPWRQSQMSSVQGSPSSQFTGSTMQKPPLQRSLVLHGLESAQSAFVVQGGAVKVTVIFGRFGTSGM